MVQSLNLRVLVNFFNTFNYYFYGLAIYDSHLFKADNLRILMTDFELNKIKSVGSHGNGKTKSNRLYGICLKNDREQLNPTL